MGHIMGDSLVYTFVGVPLKFYGGTREWAQL